MRAVVLSDSHGDIRACEKAIDSMGTVDLIIHLGDIARDVRNISQRYPEIRLVSVIGNNDLSFSKDELEKIVDFDGHKIFICHGHTLGVNHGTERLESVALQKGCTAALFGHTHCAVDKKAGSGILVLNPGSVSRPRSGSASFAVLETDGGKLSTMICDWIL